MGGVQGHQDNRLFNWARVQAHTYVNTQTNQIIDHQQVILQNQSSIAQYGKRINLHKPHIVQLLFYRKVSNTCDCNSNNTVLDVYVEGGLQSLQHIHQGPLVNFKCYCQQIVKGFETLRQQYGPFQVSLQMIWVDQNNNAKVWLNKNFFLNDLEPTNQNIMVLQIKQILSRLSCNCNLSKNQLTFDHFRITNLLGNPYMQFNMLSPKVNSNNTNSFNKSLPLISQYNNRISSKKIIKSPDKLNNFSYFYPEHYYSKTIQVNQVKSPKFIQKKASQQRSFQQHNYIQAQSQKQNALNIKKQKNYSLCENKKSFEGCFEQKLNPLSNKLVYHKQFPQVITSYTPVKVLTQINSPVQTKNKSLSNNKLITFQYYQPIKNQSSIRKAENVILYEPNTKLRVNSPLQTKKQQNTSYSSNYNRQKDHEKLSAGKLKSQQINISSFKQGSIQSTLEKELQKPNNKCSLREVKQNDYGPILGVWASKIQSPQKELYRSSLTDRQINDQITCELTNQKQTDKAEQLSVETQKINSNDTQQLTENIKYQMPQKTRKLIEKYLKNNQEQQIDDTKRKQKQVILKKKNQQFEYQKKEFKIIQKNFKNLLTLKKPKILKNIIDGQSSKQVSRSINTVDKTRSKIFNKQQSVEQLADERIPKSNQKNGQEKKEEQSSKYYQRQKLKKQMELIFNSPVDDQESIIKKKVAEKKAFFADLKAQASKILENNGT